MRNKRAWPQQCWKSFANGSNIVALRFGDHGTKEVLGDVGWKVWPVSNFAQQHPTTCNRVCKLTQHVTSNNAGSCLLTVLRPTANNKIKDIQQPDEYETDSDNESDEEGDFEVVYGRTCMTRSGRSVRDHDWCVWIYEAGVILMVIRLNLIYTYDSKNRLREVLIVIAYPFLLLRLDNYVLFYFLHVLINCTSGWVYVNSPGDIHFWI